MLGFWDYRVCVVIEVPVVVKAGLRDACLTAGGIESWGRDWVPCLSNAQGSRCSLQQLEREVL